MACPRRYKVKLVSFARLLSTMRFQMSPQVACIRRGIVTLVTFAWLFSTVPFQMCPQIVCTRRGINTLAAFIWLLSTVRFQMSPQLACLRESKVTLVAFLWLNGIVRSLLLDIYIYKTLFHCHFVVCFIQMASSNWVEFLIAFWAITSIYFLMHTFTFWSDNISFSCYGRHPVKKSSF